ncbi:MAG: dehydrogenase, partial [Clostridia bacterium]|nr:dehydrogenase [Clostridia bacterium]
MASKKVKTVYKGAGLCSFGFGSNLAETDVIDGKIVRSRPAKYDKKYDLKRFRPWTIKARGSEFKAADRSLIPPFALGYKKRITSPNRILYPLKRVDWDPDGERNPQNRGKS